LLALSDRMSARLRAKGLVGRCVTIKIREHDFTTCTRQKHFAPASHDSAVLGRLARALLSRWLEQNPGARLRLLGVGASELSPADASPGTQADLFAAQPQASAGDAPLDSALDRIREKFGQLAVKRGSTLRGSEPERPARRPRP
jgi:DNA polymerase-4